MQSPDTSLFSPGARFAHVAYIAYIAYIEQNPQTESQLNPN